MCPGHSVPGAIPEPGWASEEESGWKSRIPAGKAKNSLLQPRYRGWTGGSRWLQGCRRSTSCWEQLRCATHSPLTKQDTPARTCASPVMHVPAPRPRLLAHTHTYMHNFAGRCAHPIPAHTSILAGIARCLQSERKVGLSACEHDQAVGA